ncbi:hypothetical protein [Acidicapsa acidisoli]|uniref:hypothetical protein n=1 Tax=Acidicapsa acidisoli TaxID=1615681 RepID=UPI0021DFEE93|nr:hypothetical protein [Acidicapsa acidisoli]
MLRFLPAVLAFCMTALLPVSCAAQQDDSAKNAQQARAALDAMVKALGGDAWLNMQNREYHGRSAGFYHGKPSGATVEYWEIHQWPDHDRAEFTKHRDVVQIYTGREGWEVIYSGKKALPQEQVDDFLRRRDHSIETVVKQWLKDPNSILIYEGQHMSESHMADQVTVISAQNESVTIQLDVQTHLPLRRTFQWRDPEYKDKDEDTEEYDNYRPVDGFQTPYNITRFKNGDMINQRFLFGATYNQSLPADEFTPDAAAAKIVKKK